MRGDVEQSIYEYKACAVCLSEVRVIFDTYARLPKVLVIRSNLGLG